jgi:hypothetical protein
MGGNRRVPFYRSARGGRGSPLRGHSVRGNPPTCAEFVAEVVRVFHDVHSRALRPGHCVNSPSDQPVTSGQLSRCVQARCSPTFTIFIVLVPPDLPMGSPIVSTITSPGLTWPLATSRPSAASSTLSRSALCSR